MFGAMVMLAAYVAILVTKSFWVMIATLFVVGMANTFRSQLCFVYMLEFIPRSKHAMVGSIYFVCEGLTSLFGVVYFTWISKHWIWFALIGFTF